MMKTAIALAVAGTLIAPAVYADTSNVNVYGELRLGLENINGATTNAVAATPATAYALAVKGSADTIPSSTVRAVDNTSIFGVKGFEDLGSDWQAQFQLEGALHADGSSAASLNTRNTFVAIKQAKLGTLLAGQYDTPYKVARGYLTVTPLDNSTAEVSTFWGHANGANTFYTRQSDTVQYLSPTWAGFNFRIGFGPDQSKTTTTDKQRWSFAGIYDGSRFLGSIAYETRANSAPVATDSYSATAATAGVKVGTGDVVVGVEHFGATGTNKFDSSISQSNYYLATNWKVGESWDVGGHFAYAGNSNVGNDNNAHVVSIGIRYDVSKRTNVISYYSHISNSGNAVYNFNVNPESGTVIAGEGPTVVGVGLNHKF